MKRLRIEIRDSTGFVHLGFRPIEEKSTFIAAFRKAIEQSYAILGMSGPTGTLYICTRHIVSMKLEEVDSDE